MNVILTIAGSDSGAGAGIQADIKTALSLGVYATTVITALTAQNTVEVADIMQVPSYFVEKQLDCVFTDLFPDAVKIGMLFDSEIVTMVTDKLKQYKVKKIVVDPVMCATSGKMLLDEPGRQALRNKLLPLAQIITPNIPEAEVLWGRDITNERQMEQAAQDISHMLGGAAVLVKGGHMTGASDVLFDQNKTVWFVADPVDNPNTHGTGCTLSSAIACYLAKGLPKEESVRRAKQYLTGAIHAGLNLGKGPGPLNHGYHYWS